MCGYQPINVCVFRPSKHQRLTERLKLIWRQPRGNLVGHVALEDKGDCHFEASVDERLTPIVVMILGAAIRSLRMTRRRSGVTAVSRKRAKHAPDIAYVILNRDVSRRHGKASGPGRSHSKRVVESKTCHGPHASRLALAPRLVSHPAKPVPCDYNV